VPNGIPAADAGMPRRSAAESRMMSERTWWFVLRDGDTCEVQLLDRHGAAAAFARFVPGTAAIEVGGQRVPESVLRLAESCVPGGGQYADSEGRLLDLMGQPLA
jgi:hypothetical protein